jgi:hypothetical protein
MTTPPTESGPPVASSLRRGQLVTFTRTDSILGGQVSGVGVVVDLGDDGAPVVIRPVEYFTVSADPENVSPVSVADLV